MKVRIYQRPKNAMQSGSARNDEWIVEYIAVDRQKADILTGWAGSEDTGKQVKLRFENCETAKAYAERKGLMYEIIQPREPKLKLQSYADNFR